MAELNHQIPSAIEQLRQLAGKKGISLLDADYSATALAKRAAERMRLDMMARQKNVEHILRLAERRCEDHTGSELDEDWFNEYLELAQKVSVPSMQSLWARILAEELKQPGRYSTRTLRALKQINQREAALLQRVVALCVSWGEDPQLKLLTGFYRLPGKLDLFPKRQAQRFSLGRFRCSYSQLLQLIDLELLQQQELETAELNPGELIQLHYQQQQAELIPRGRRLHLTYYRLTPLGNELAQLLGRDEDIGYLEQLTQWLESDFSLRLIASPENTD